MKKTVLSNTKGSLFLKLIVVLAVLTAITGASLSLFLSNLNEQKIMNIKATLQNLQKKIQFLILSENSWNNTLGLPINSMTLNCLSNKAQICKGSFWNDIDKTLNPQQFKLQLSDSEGNLFLGDIYSSPNIGLTLDGHYCNTFDFINGNDECPLQIQTKWHRSCVDATKNQNILLCPYSSLLVTVIVDFIYKGKKNLPINMDKYRIIVTRHGPSGSGEVELSREQIRDKTDGTISSGVYFYNPQPLGNVWAPIISGGMTTIAMKEKTIKRNFTLPGVQKALLIVNGFIQSHHPSSLGTVGNIQVFIGKDASFETFCASEANSAPLNKTVNSSFSCAREVNSSTTSSSSQVSFILTVSYHAYYFSGLVSISDPYYFPVIDNVSIDYVLYKYK